MVATKAQLTERNALDRRIQLSGLLVLPLRLAQVEDLLGQCSLGPVAILEQERLHQGEIDLLTDRFIPYPRERTGVRQAAQVIGGRVTLATLVRAHLHIVHRLEVGHAVDHRITQAGVADQHVLFIAIEDLAEVAADLGNQGAVSVLLDPHEGGVIVRQHRLGEHQQLGQALDPVVQVAVAQDQHQGVADLAVGAVAERPGVGVHEVLQRRQWQVELRIQLEARLGDIGLQHQVGTLLFAQGEEVAIQPLVLAVQLGLVGRLMRDAFQADHTQQPIRREFDDAFMPDVMFHQGRQHLG
ncbi:hypothetical protein D3C84_659350 [compost metagenome]